MIAQICSILFNFASPDGYRDCSILSIVFNGCFNPFPGCFKFINYILIDIPTTSPDCSENELMYQCNNVPMYQWNSRFCLKLEGMSSLQRKAGWELLFGAGRLMLQIIYLIISIYFLETNNLQTICHHKV